VVIGQRVEVYLSSLLGPILDLVDIFEFPLENKGWTSFELYHGARLRPGRLVEVVQLRLFKAKEGRSYSILCDKYIPNPRLEPGVPPIRRLREVICRIVTLG
jgi:hypothetical protein